MKHAKASRKDLIVGVGGCVAQTEARISLKNTSISTLLLVQTPSIQSMIWFIVLMR